MGWERSQELIKKFEPFLYLKKVLETMSNFWPIGAGTRHLILVHLNQILKEDFGVR